MTTRHDRKVSILDVMGPVMVGPSSSHTAGTARLGRVAREILDEDPVAVHFSEEDLGDVHPNTVRIEIRGKTREGEIVGSSIGGGVIEVFKINGFQTRFKGDSPTLLLFYRDRPGMISEVTQIIADEGINIASLSCSRKQRGKDAFMQIDVDSPLSKAALERICSIGDVARAQYLDRIP